MLALSAVAGVAVWSQSLGLLGGSWVVISGVISPLIWVITIVTLLITPLITTHEPPSNWQSYLCHDQESPHDVALQGYLCRRKGSHKTWNTPES